MSKCSHCETTGVVGVICDRCRIAELEAVQKSLMKIIDEYEEADKADMKFEDRVAELEAELARHEWVSVEDKLPKQDDDRVLIFTKGVVSEGFYMPETDDWTFILTLGAMHSSGTVKVTHWKPIILPEPPASKAGVRPAKEGCKMPVEMKSHWFEHCESDNPTANCLMCGNWKGAGATFLPKCKWRRSCGTCYNLGSINRGGPCSKRCDCPGPEVDND
jgi:hypothetical protein